MKKILFWSEILLLVVCFVGCALSLVGSVMLAIDNAMYDYYNDTSRQASGWLLTLSPILIVAAGASMYFLRRKIKVFEYCGVGIMFLAVFIPFIYMIKYAVLLQFNVIGLALWFVSAQGFLMLSYFNNRVKEET